jgi:hypothetical protein
VKKRPGEHGERPLRIFVLDCEALSLAVRGDRKMIAWIDHASRGEAEVVTSPMTLVEAYDGRTTEQRWDWVLSRLKVADRPAGSWPTPSCTATNTRSTRCSPSSRDSRKGRSPSSPRTWTTWRSWSRTRSSSRRYDPISWSQFWSHSPPSSTVHQALAALLRPRSGRPRPTPTPRTNIWKACWGQPLTSSNLVSSTPA